MLVPDLYRQRNGFQRTHLTAGSCPARIVLLSDPVHLATETARTSTTLRTFQDG
jgi:hypothetical protein